MKITREQKKGIIGTVIVHLAVIFMLFLLVLRTPLPLPGEEGVEIRMGNSDEGAFSENIGAISASAPVASPQSLDEDEVVTQSEEETVAIETKPIRNPQQEQPETKSNPEPKPDPEPVVDPRAMYTGSSASSPGGGTGNSGDFGRPDGTSQTGGLTGGGQGDGTGSGSGKGQGGDYFLRGREIKSLIRPTYNSGEQGRVVVEIIVDRNGNVLKVRAGAKVSDTNIGTTTSDPKLWKQAEEAALKSKFSQNNNAAEQQKGYIIYNFVKQGE